MLTPKETGGRGNAGLVRVDHSALCEEGFACPQAVADEAAMALGWKPTAVDPAYPLCDPTHHYLLTVRKAGAAVTVWKQGVELGNYETTAATYAELLAEALARFAGTANGYLSRLIVVERCLDYSAFFQPSSVWAGLWTVRSLSGLDIHTLLDFGNAAALGADVSGNGNDWTLPGAVQSVDTPTNNQAILNRAGTYPGVYSAGNTAWNGTYSNGGAKASIGVSSGKWYAEFSKDTDASQIAFGVSKHADRGYYPGYFPDEYGWHSSSSGSFVMENNSTTEWGTGYTNADRVRMALDMDIGAVWFGKNGTWENGATDAEIIAGDTTHAAATWPPDGRTYFIACGRGGTTCVVHAYFPAASWGHQAPEGFLPLCDASLPEPAFTGSARHYFASIFTAPADGPQDIVVGWDAEASGFGMRLKNLDRAEDWLYVSTVTGLGHAVRQGDAGTLSAKTELAAPIIVSGDTITVPGDLVAGGDSYFIEVFRIGPESGFNVVEYVGDELSGRAVPHGLGRAPFFIVHMADDETAGDKFVFSKPFFDLNPDYSLRFNADAAVTADPAIWNGTAPDAANVYLGNAEAINGPGSRFSLWMWSEAAVYRDFSYTGNGSADGPFIGLDGRFLGLLGVKGAGTAAWTVANRLFGERNPLANRGLHADSAAIFAPENGVNVLSAGCKIVNGTTAYNGNAQLYAGVAIVDQTKYRNAF